MFVELGERLMVVFLQSQVEQPSGSKLVYFPYMQFIWEHYGAIFQRLYLVWMHLHYQVQVSYAYPWYQCWLYNFWMAYPLTRPSWMCNFDHFSLKPSYLVGTPWEAQSLSVCHVPTCEHMLDSLLNIFWLLLRDIHLFIMMINDLFHHILISYGTHIHVWFIIWYVYTYIHIYNLSLCNKNPWIIRDRFNVKLCPRGLLIPCMVDELRKWITMLQSGCDPEKRRVIKERGDNGMVKKTINKASQKTVVSNTQ